MDTVFIILILLVLIGIYDLTRRINAQSIKQIEELKLIREELRKNKNSQ